jgi:hypothetical protein
LPHVCFRPRDAGDRQGAYSLIETAISMTLNAAPARSSRVEHGGESAIDHALSVEGHIGLVGSHARIGHQLGPGVVARLLRRPFDPAEDDRLAVFRFDRAPKVGDLAVRDVIAPAFDDAQRAIFP